jgi:hypothetical protein
MDRFVRRGATRDEATHAPNHDPPRSSPPVAASEPYTDPVPSSDLYNDAGPSPLQVSKAFTSHSCVFELRDKLWYNNKQLTGVKYRTRHKRTTTKARTSWVWQHGADVEAVGYSKLFICRICHDSKRAGGIFNGAATCSIASHLEIQHSLLNPLTRERLSKSSVYALQYLPLPARLSMT